MFPEQQFRKLGRRIQIMGRRHQLRGTVIESQKLSEKDRRALKIVSKNHINAAAKVTAEQKWQQNLIFIYRTCLKKRSVESFTNPTSTVQLQLWILWWLKTKLKGEKDGVTIIKRGRLMIGNTQYSQMSCPSHCYQHQVGFRFGACSRKPIILNAWFQLWNMEKDLWWCD